MVVVYYTQTYFLDAALETIQSLKKVTSLHLLIEIAPESQKSTIIEVDSLGGHAPIESFRAVVGEGEFRRFLPYLDGIASVRFIIHKTKKAFSPISFLVCRKVINLINDISPDIIHFDTISVRSIGLIGLSRKFKIHITIHDPIPHSGEISWKKKLTKFLFYRIATHFFFYSRFAEHQFRLHNSAIHKGTSCLRFQPFSFLAQFANPKDSASKYILFFGRMSPYKGIDILLKSIPIVLAQFPESKFIVAGSNDNYSIPYEMVMPIKDSITIISGYLSTQEVADLIQNSAFIVCPYRDATQSGVLMTAYAFAKPVLATRVGAFPEYIDDGYTGLLSDVEPSHFAQIICEALTDEKYKYYSRHINSCFSASEDLNNQQSLLKAYSS